MSFIKEKKKIIIISGCILLALILAFVVYWKATEHDRYINKSIETFTEGIEQCKIDVANGEEPSFYFNFNENEYIMSDATFKDFFMAELMDLIENKEFSVLNAILVEYIENPSYDSSDDGSGEAQTIVTDGITSLDSFEDVISAYKTLSDLSTYYTSSLYLRDSQIFLSYLEKHGEEQTTQYSGEGYYANCKDSSSKTVIGIEGSPLYDAREVSYYGDFKEVHDFGVELNEYYRETKYSDYTYYFRDVRLDAYAGSFPLDGECILSGDYLICFSYDGKLLGIYSL